MIISVNFNNIDYRIDFDDVFLRDKLSFLGILPVISRETTIRAVALFTAYPTRIKTVYEKIAAMDGVDPHTIEIRIAKGLKNAVASGDLKNIDDLFDGYFVYDYESDYTSKEFVALMSDFMVNNGLIKVDVNN